MTTSPRFADRIVNIAVTGPLVRLELGVMQPPMAEGQKPQLVPTEALVMPLEGLVASMGMLEALIKKLVADGVLRVQAPASATAPDPGAEKADTPPRQPATR
jgi:hypothetical protein